MVLRIDKAKSSEYDLLNKMQAESFETTKHYFPNGELPPPPENEIDLSFERFLNNADYTVLSILCDSDIIGSAVIKEQGDNIREIELFFIKADKIGNGIGSQALKMIEDFFPNTRIWRLITPTLVMKNVVFYINKCGYHIVKVQNFDRNTNTGVYLFEKECK